LSVVLDAEGLLIFYLDEPGAETLQRYLQRIQAGELTGYLNIVNLTEFYYILSRRDPKLADEKEKNLRSYGLKVVPVTDDRLWKEASLIKAKHALSLADAFAAATAKVIKAKLITGRDEEFKETGVPLIKVR
jgi:predicted nucleic acid-binding protein